MKARWWGPPLAVALTPLLYALAAAGFGAWPVGAPPPVAGEMLAIIDNGYHSDLVVPAEPWRGVLSLPPDARWLLIGWGDEAFYRETPTIADLKPGTALRAILGLGPAVLHVEWLDAFPAGDIVHRFRASNSQRAAIEAYIADTLRQPVTRLPGGYGPDDGFYAATGRWSPWVTCNEWAAGALRRAGIRTARWAVMPGAVTRFLTENPLSTDP